MTNQNKKPETREEIRMSQRVEGYKGRRGRNLGRITE